MNPLQSPQATSLAAGAQEKRPPEALLTHILQQVLLLHSKIDEQTRDLRTVLSSHSDAVRRAEEAGAALHRLEWALERAAQLGKATHRR